MWKLLTRLEPPVEVPELIGGRPRSPDREPVLHVPDRDPLRLQDVVVDVDAAYGRVVLAASAASPFLNVTVCVFIWTIEKTALGFVALCLTAHP